MAKMFGIYCSQSQSHNSMMHPASLSQQCDLSTCMEGGCLVNSIVPPQQTCHSASQRGSATFWGKPLGGQGEHAPDAVPRHGWSPLGDAVSQEASPRPCVLTC